MPTCGQELLSRSPYEGFINAIVMNEENSSAIHINHRGLLWILLITTLLLLLLAMAAAKFRQPIPKKMDMNIKQGNVKIETEFNVP
jgi:hypothetical protein